MSKIEEADGGVRDRKAKRPKPARGKALGILNPYGDLWTYETFQTEELARAYIKAFWAPIDHGPDLSKFTVIPVKVTVSAIADTSGQQSVPGRQK